MVRNHNTRRRHAVYKASTYKSLSHYITTDEPRRWVQCNSREGARRRLAPASIPDDGNEAPIRPLLSQQKSLEHCAHTLA
jgi:hypothetical protein